MQILLDQMQLLCWTVEWRGMINFALWLFVRCNVRKRTFGHVRWAKILIRLRNRASWLSALWVAKATVSSCGHRILWSDCWAARHAHSCNLIRIFTWRILDSQGKFLHADNEDTDQTVWMRRLIWVFVGRTFTFTHVEAHLLIFFPMA